MPLPPGDPQRHAALDLRSQVNQRLAGLSPRQTGAAFDRGLALARDQLSAAQALAQEVPGPKSQETLRVAHDFLAVRLLSEGQPAQALPHSEKAVELARSLLPVRPARDAGVALASSLVRLAEIQAHLLQPAQATARLEEALALVRGLHMAEPDDRHLRARYANVGWRVGEVNHLMGHAAALQSNATVLPEVLLAADFKPADGVFYMQRKRVQQELARTKLRRGDAAGALRSLADFAAQMPPHPVAAADLAEVFLLRAQALTALNQRGPAGQALEAGFAAIQAAHGATPGNVQLACRWLQLRMQFAAALAPTPVADEPVGPAVAALQRQGKLSPYWAQALQAAPP